MGRLSPKKKPSGKSVPEEQRHTVRVVVRVPPEIAEALDELAEEWGVGRSAVVVRLVVKERET